MKRGMFIIVAILLWSNVAYAQDIEREKHFKLVERIMSNPDKIAEIIDSSDYYNKIARKFALNNERLSEFASIFNREYKENGETWYSFIKNDKEEIVWIPGAEYHGPIFSHEIILKNKQEKRFTYFIFSQVARKWYLSEILSMNQYPRPRGGPSHDSIDE